MEHGRPFPIHLFFATGHSIYTVLARRATLTTLSVYSYYSVKYWCGGAALLAKLWFCWSACAGFGKCAAWGGLTFGLDMPQTVHLRNLLTQLFLHGLFLWYLPTTWMREVAKLFKGKKLGLMPVCVLSKANSILIF